MIQREHMKALHAHFLPIVLLTSSLPATVIISENSPSHLTFTWKLDSYDTLSLMDSGRYVTSLSFDDENIMLGDYGEAAVPGHSVYAGIPLTGNVSVSFTPGPSRTIRLAHPLKRHPERSAQMGNGSRTDIRQGAGWVTEPRYTWFRNLRAAHVVIAPVKYDEQQMTVELLESGTCTIAFPYGAQSARTAGIPSDYQRMLKRLLLNYGRALPWTKSMVRPLKKAADPYPFDYNQQVYTFKIGDGHSGFNETTVKENGIIKIPGSQIKRKFSSDSALIGMTSVALYGSWKGALPMVAPGTGAIPAGVREIPLFRYDANQNNKVDDEDYFLAFVTGLSDWRFDTASKKFVFSVDAYDDNRTYWLALKSSGTGATMGKYRQPSFGSLDTAGKFINRIVFKESNKKFVRVNAGIPLEEDAIGFVWVVLNSSKRDFKMPLDLPYCDTTDSGSLRFVAFDWKDATVTIDANVGVDSICTNCEMETEYPIRRWGDKNLRMVMTNPQATYYLQLDHIEVKYPQQLSAARDTLNMMAFSKIDSFPVTYRLSRMNDKKVWIMRIPDDEDSVTFVDSVSNVGSYAWSDQGNAGVRYAVYNEAGFIRIDDNAFTNPERSTASGYVASRLRDIENESDYIIITQSLLFNQAKRLAAHKASHGFSHPLVVSVNDIYTDFSGGNVDPTAIRNFLAFAQRNWKNGDRLDYVVLMGAGHYDYKQVKTSEPNYVIPAEVTGYSYPFTLGTSCADDYYGYLGTNDTSAMSLSIGRLPCASESEAAVMVDKIIETEDGRKADWGSWRNSALLVADDDMQGSREDLIRGDFGHHASSERVAMVMDALRPSMDIRKTYLFDYAWNSNWEKPEASRAIINEINSGTGYVNFFGHGSETYWTDEHVLSPDIVPQLYNEKRYPIVSSYSCSVGKFDKPENVSLGELLIKLPGAGAIASFAGTRSASAAGNEVLAIDIYSALFDTSSAMTLGMAILKGKSLHHDVNSMIYILFGDPSIRLVSPARSVAIEVLDSAGAPRDTFMALEKITVRGTIVDGQGAIDGSVGSTSSAYVQIGLYNAAENTTRKDGGEDQTVHYMQPGKPIFSGRFPVRNGVFEQNAVLPPNLSFDKQGTKLSAFAWQGSEDALGCKKTIVFHGTKPPDQTTDTVGPRITIRPVYEVSNMLSTAASFSDRITSSLPLKCEIVLDDPSGINVMGSGPDEGLTMEIPGVLSRRNINHKFQFAEGDFRSGTAVTSFEEKSLKIGKYELIVTAQDLLGKVSKVAVSLEITDENEPTLDRVFNTPNPVKMGQTTRFFFYPSTAQPYLNARFIVKIFSLSGKLLRVFKDARNGETWDLKDQNGYPLPPNIYLYQVTGYYVTDKQVKSKIQKVVIHPPR
jgi:hypothetical protein